jgi:hypothetical protein
MHIAVTRRDVRPVTSRDRQESRVLRERLRVPMQTGVDPVGRDEG